MTDTLTKLIKRRDRIGDALQILEMSAGYRNMMASPQNRKYKALNARIRQLEARKDKSPPTHTPGPWYIEDGRIYGQEARDDYLICDLAPGNQGINETDEANAEFIVRACNSHYELLETLERILEGDLMSNMEEIVLAVIAKARDSIDVAALA